jgi:hypothetical protein
MSLSLDDLKTEIDEYHNRIEEVLSGMDRVLAQLDRRVGTLEGQLGALAAALTDGAENAISRDAGADLSTLKADISKVKSRIRGKP